MSTLLEFATGIRAVCEERDLLVKACADASAELSSMQRDRDILRKSVHAWQEAEATARRRWQEERIKCDQARTELAGVAAQRDAHLSRSVELAAHVTKLEGLLDRKQLVNDSLREELTAEQAKLAKSGTEIERLSYHLATWRRVSALYPNLTISEIINRVLDLAKRDTAATPPVAEVDGFRVGDLVRSVDPRSPDYGKVIVVGEVVRVEFATFAASYMPSKLTRKPVEVGDTVRVTIESHAGKLGKFTEHGQPGRCDLVHLDEGTLLYVPSGHVVAIAPTVKP